MKSWQLLGYLGLLPFIVSLYFSVESVSWVIAAKQAFVAYSAIIVSFIAVSIWRKDDNNTHNKQYLQFTRIYNLINLHKYCLNNASFQFFVFIHLRKRISEM